MLLKAAFLLIVGVVFPLLAIQSDLYLRSGNPFPPRPQVWRGVLGTQWFLAAIALITAWHLNLDLFPPPSFDLRALLLAALVLGLALSLMAAGNALTSGKQLDRLLKLGPRGKGDLGWWLLISLTAGIAEELVYRGVLTSVLTPMVGGLLPAALISAAIFAITHMVQGILSALIIFFFALGFQWLVSISGNLYLAMAVHAFYDFAAGLYILSVLRRRGSAPP